MIGKLIVHQPTRDEAISCMQRTLNELRIEGIRTTVPFHQKGDGPFRVCAKAESTPVSWNGTPRTSGINTDRIVRRVSFGSWSGHPACRAAEIPAPLTTSLWCWARR